jgi:hypothetical protein
MIKKGITIKVKEHHKNNKGYVDKRYNTYQLMKQKLSDDFTNVMKNTEKYTNIECIVFG